jgi:hypothetical protein
MLSHATLIAMLSRATLIAAPVATDEMEVMHDRVTQLERENASLRLQLQDREQELQWLK